MEVIQINSTQTSLVFELFDKYRVFYGQESNLELAKSFIQERQDNHESVIFVALSDDKKQPIGFTQLYPIYSSVRAVKNWLLNDLYVDNAYRKQGIGENLIRAAMDFAKEQNAKFIELSTAVTNQTAQSLYEHIGFEKQNPDTEYYTYRIDLK